MSLGSLQNLEILNLGLNQLIEEAGVISSIFNSILLRALNLNDNPLNGTMPDSFRNQFYSLQSIYAPRCQIQIRGPIWNDILVRSICHDLAPTCSSPDVRALSHGSLKKLLYSHNYCLSLVQSVSVLIDISSALEYLHLGQSVVVVHCDLKPRNILLDEDMVAHVADFGLGKVLAENKEETQTRTLGTLGYIAPDISLVTEYGSEGKVSAKGDIYSFGIILFEILTRKKPTDELFSGELTLRQRIYASIPEMVTKVVDNGMLDIEDGRDVNFLESIILRIMELGLECTLESPEERVDIKVVRKLNKVKLALCHDSTLCV